MRKLIDWTSTIFAWVSVLSAIAGTIYLSSYLDEEPVVSEAEAFAITVEKVKIVERIPPPYQNCALEHGWCDRLAEALVYEARGEGAIGMRAVAHVIMERKESRGWPNTIREVIEQRKQFSYLEDMHRQKKPTEEDFDIAYKEAYNAYFHLSENPVPGAKWYHSVNIRPPKWTKELEVVKIIGNHIFYKEKSFG